MAWPPTTGAERSTDHYVCFAPRGPGIAARFDSTAGQFGSAWTTYDVNRVASFDGGSPQYAGAAFDGRCVYFIPTVAGFVTVARYDTLSTFAADCAWSTFDLTQLDAEAIQERQLQQRDLRRPVPLPHAGGRLRLRTLQGQGPPSAMPAFRRSTGPSCDEHEK